VIHKLLQAVAARAVHAEPEEARCILAWAAPVRGQLDLRDPVAALLQLSLSVPTTATGLLYGFPANSAYPLE
jgi:hypothetical protein